MEVGVSPLAASAALWLRCAEQLQQRLTDGAQVNSTDTDGADGADGAEDFTHVSVPLHPASSLRSLSLSTARRMNFISDASLLQVRPQVLFEHAEPQTQTQSSVTFTHAGIFLISCDCC